MAVLSRLYGDFALGFALSFLPAPLIYLCFKHRAFERNQPNLEEQIKGPENPKRQLLPIMSTKCCSGDEERRKDKGGGGGSRSKTKLCVTKSYVKDGV